MRDPIQEPLDVWRTVGNWQEYNMALFRYVRSMFPTIDHEHLPITFRIGDDTKYFMAARDAVIEWFKKQEAEVARP